MNYAVRNGEDFKVWQYFDDMRIKNKLAEILYRVDGLSDSSNDNVLSNDYYNTVLSQLRGKMAQQINEGIAMPALVNKLSELAAKQGFVQQSEELKTLSTQLPPRERKSAAQMEREKKELNKVFMKLEDEEVQKLWKELNEKYGIGAEYLNSLNDGDLKELYDAFTLKDRQSI
jgi:hypothetical protein